MSASNQSNQIKTDFLQTPIVYTEVIFNMESIGAYKGQTKRDMSRHHG